MASSQGPPSFTRRVEIDEVSKMLGDAENSTQNMGKQEDKSKHKDDALEELRVSRFEGFSTPAWKKFLFLLASVLSGGLVYLFAEWIVAFKAAMTLSPCEDLEQASHAVAHLKDGRSMLVAIERKPGMSPRLECCGIRYTFDAVIRTFTPVPSLPYTFDAELKAASRDVALQGFLSRSSLSWRRDQRLEEFGANEMVIPLPSPYRLFFEEAIHPFYVFQYFSVAIWSADGYYSYSIIIFLITMVSISVNVRLTYTNRLRLASLAHFDESVKMIPPGGGSQLASSKDLVPGDLVEVTNGILPCDLVVLSGECVVDENMLTGEAVPVRKVAYSIQSDGLKTFDPDVLAGTTLFGGTVVAQAKGAARGKPCIGMVCRTGFSTAKGTLLRQILHPKPHQLNFVSDALKFIIFMFVIGLLFYIWSIVSLVRFHTHAGEIIFKYLDMITVAVPPALAACLTIATTVAIGRLNEKRVFVSQPNVINMAGLLDVMCFDKTGTLTEPGLDLKGLVPVTPMDGKGNGKGTAPAFERLVTTVDGLRPEYQELCALCHGLAKLGEQVVGDPLDQKLFAATQWTMEEETEHAYDEGSPRAALHGHPSSSLTALLSSALNRNLEGLNSLPPHEKGDMAESWGEFGRTGAVLVSPTDGAPMNPEPPAAPEEPLDMGAGAGAGGATSTRPITIGNAAAHAVALSDPPTDGSLSGTPGQKALGKKVTSVVLPIKPASSWPGFKDLAQSLEGGVPSPDTRSSVRMAGLSPDGSEHGGGQYAATARLLADGKDSAAPLPGHLALTVNPRPEEPRFLLLRRFEFSSEKARMGVLAKHPNGSLVLYVKGAPEVVKGLVEPSSLPSDFEGELAKYTRDGLRVLGLASRDLPSVSESDAMAAPQEQLEKGLRFLGFAVMINRLKADTADVIGHLQAANMRCAMITGDHIVTGVSIARQCGILDPAKPVAVIDRAKDHPPTAPALAYALLQPDGALEPLPDSIHDELLRKVDCGEWECGVTGHGFAALQLLGGPRIVEPEPEEEESAAAAPVGRVTVNGAVYDVEVGAGGSDGGDAAVAALRRMVLKRGGVFARMSPEGKKAVVDCMGQGFSDANGRAVKGLGHYVGFCGDGANDLAVLKTALVGVSLCDADASVAAPLTSKNQSISCVVDVVAEGRCSLVTAYNIFQFVMVYAFVQVFAANLMYTNGLVVGNYQYLIQDLMYSTVLATVMSLTHPQDKLGPARPTARLTSWAIMIPVLLQFAVAGVFQGLGLYLLGRQPWYVRFRPGPGIPPLSVSRSPENTVVFNISLAQLLIAAVVFNKGRPFRRPMYTNVRMMGTLLVQSAFLIYLVMAPRGWIITKFAELVNYAMTAKFRGQIILLILVNLAVAYAVQLVAEAIIGAVPKLQGDMMDLEAMKRRAKAARKRAMAVREGRRERAAENSNAGTAHAQNGRLGGMGPNGAVAVSVAGRASESERKALLPQQQH